MRLVDYATHNLNNNMSMTTLCLDIEKAFDTTWHTGILYIYIYIYIYMLSKLEFSTSLIKLLSCFLSKKKKQYFAGRRNVCAKRNASRGASRFCPVLYTVQFVYINDGPQTPDVHLHLFADDSCLYARIARRILFSENCSAVSAQWRHGMSAGT
jgi:hypothetical protein